MARPDKTAAVAELAEEFRSSNAAVLTEYRGLTVAQLKELRRSLSGADTTYSVVKNTLTKIAARDAGVSGFEDLLEGPSAIAFIKGDPVEAAKGLRDFARTHPLLVIKGGVLDGNPLSPDEIRKLADLESREVLLAKMAGAMQASLQNAVSLFAAPLAQTARVLEALRAKAEQDPSVLAGGAGTPAAPADATPDTTAEAPGEPAAQSTEAPASESAEAPASESAEAPASESAEAPASESAEAPASESTEA
ncbi:MAG: large subunit ribosomal protein [Actinomycetota bacterium]|jgi:large subunit ribosomal protein L10|nr:large subunit ribosomal protein [Actinomycetota bacterium]